MLFRREAVLGLSFDEQLPTYAGEDKEFSMDVGRDWALALRADLPLAHHRSRTSRDDEVKRMYQVGFGMGRGFGRRMTGCETTPSRCDTRPARWSCSSSGS